MNAFCEWDRGDCLEKTQCAQNCLMSMLGDGTCQPACLVPACNFDNRDCECANVIETDTGYRSDGTTIGSYYDNGLDSCWLLRPRLPNVTSVTLSFARFSTEAYYDVLRVYDGQHQGARQLYPGGISGTGYPSAVTSSVRRVAAGLADERLLHCRIACARRKCKRADACSLGWLALLSSAPSALAQFALCSLLSRPVSCSRCANTTTHHFSVRPSAPT